MTILFLFPLAIALVASNVYSWRAFRNLSAYGEEHRLRVVYWSRFFAGRQNFTELGWRYRNRALLCLLVWPISIGLMLFVG